MRLERHLAQLARAALAEALSIDDADPMLRPATDPRFGDFQVNAAMALGKRLGKKPRELAGPLAEALARYEEVASAEVAGPGFVNLRLDDAWVAGALGEMAADTVHDGIPRVDRPEIVVVDYSSPNVAKQMHVGHLRSTILGDAVVRLLRRVGHTVVGDNHIGDWGTQFGLLLAGMTLFGNEYFFQQDPIAELERVYKLASARAKEDEAFADAAREELVRLQEGDPERIALWKQFVDETIEKLNEVYLRLEVTFDEWLGESAYHDDLPDVVKQLLDAGIAREDQGAICVFFDELEGAPENLRKQETPFIVRKKDGAFNYATTDIATILHRRDHFHADRAVYVVDVRQSRHFEMLFTVARALGVEMGLDHVGFGTILGRDGKPLRTRDGGTVKLADLLDEAEKRAAERMREEGVDVPEEIFGAVASAVGIGAVKYADLRQNRLSDYRFDLDKMVSFKGNAGPYLQYAHARVRSIFRKAELRTQDAKGPIRLEDPAESELARALLRWPDVVHEAAETYQPHLVTDHLYALARAFSAFYERCPVLKAPDDDTRASRLALAALTARQLAGGLDLLGITALERM